MTSSVTRVTNRHIYAAVTVAALGYFVDVFDIILFSVLRMDSLKSLGLAPNEIMDSGIYILNMQLIGMLLGGIFWGILGDKLGRLSVLFGSILLYSVASIANAYVHTVDTYAWLRLIAGIGLAGEVGAGITLVSELLPKEKRGYGTTIVATVGVSGALAAAFVGESISWRNAYIVGGVMGLALLGLRIAVAESGMFQQAKQEKVSRGNFFMLFNSSERFFRYLSCLAVGLPIWFVVGILLTFAPEISTGLGSDSPVKTAYAISFYTVGMTIGDLMSGLLSQYLGSRRAALTAFLVLALVMTTALLAQTHITPSMYCWILVPIGFSIGYWAVLITTAAEQFGTNLRATVATTIPNFVRGSAVPMTLMFQFLKPGHGVVQSALLVGLGAIGLALLGLKFLDETFSRDLNFFEHHAKARGPVQDTLPEKKVANI